MVNKKTKVIKLDYKKAYLETRRINSNYETTIRRLQSEINFKDCLLDECSNKNELEIKGLNEKITGLQHQLDYESALVFDLRKDRAFYKKIVEYLINKNNEQ